MKNKFFHIGLFIAAFTIPAFGQSVHNFKIGTQISLPPTGPVATTSPLVSGNNAREIMAADSAGVKIIRMPWNTATATSTKEFKMPGNIIAVHFASKFNKTLKNTFAPMVFSIEKAGTVIVRVLSRPADPAPLTAVSTGTIAISATARVSLPAREQDNEVFTDANGVTFVNLVDFFKQTVYVGYTRDGKTFTSLGDSESNYNLIQTTNG